MKTRYIAAVAAAALCLGLTAHADQLALEAELSLEIEEPMVIAVPDEAQAEGGPKPDEPSNGKFVWRPGPPLVGGGDHSGSVRFTIPIKEAGAYRIFGHVVAWDGNSDSFWFAVYQDGNDEADKDLAPNATQDTNYRWSVAHGNTWHWDRVNHWLDGGTFERMWELEAGLVTIAIWNRESATMLDALYITNDEQAGTGVLPTDEDRERQRNNFDLSVNPSGKLASAWASLKAR